MAEESENKKVNSIGSGGVSDLQSKVNAEARRMPESNPIEGSSVVEGKIAVGIKKVKKYLPWARDTGTRSGQPGQGQGEPGRGEQEEPGEESQDQNEQREPDKEEEEEKPEEEGEEGEKEEGEETPEGEAGEAADRTGGTSKAVEDAAVKEEAGMAEGLTVTGGGVAGAGATTVTTEGAVAGATLFGLSISAAAIIIIVAMLIVIGLGVGLSIYCQQLPTPCGTLGFPKSPADMPEERNLQYQLLALATGQFDLNGIKDILNEVENSLKTQSLPKDPKKAQESKVLIDKGLALITEMRTMIDAKQKAESSTTPTVTVKPDEKSDKTTTVPAATQTAIKEKLKGLSEILKKLQAYDIALIYGETALPVNDSEIKSYNSTLHGYSVERPANVPGHRVFMGFTECQNSGSRNCPGDAVDINTRAGASIYATFSGKVNVNNAGTRLENIVLRSSTQSASALYAHVNADVRSGQTVQVGQKIGTISNKLKSPHVHFELWIGGKSVHHDPGTPDRKAGQGKVLYDKMRGVLKKGSL